MDPVTLDPPSDIEAEKHLVGALLLRPDGVPDVVARISSEMFYHAPYRALYGAICDLFLDAYPITADTVAARASGTGGAKPVDRAAMQEALESASSGEEAALWAERIAVAAKKRALMEAGRKAMTLARSENDPDLDISAVQEMLLSAAGDHSSLTSMPQATAAYLERLDLLADNPDALGGDPTPWHELDGLLDGLRPATTVVLYGTTGSFKTTAALNIGHFLSRRGNAGIWFTTESSVNEVTSRLIDLHAGRSMLAMRRLRKLGDHLEEFRDAAAFVSALPIWVNDNSPMDIGFLRGMVGRARKVHDVRYAIIDLIDHVHSNRFRDSETKNESFTMSQIKAMATREQITAIITAHISKPNFRSPEEARRPYLPMEALKGSFSKAQDADVVISLMMVREEGNGWIPLDYDGMVQERKMHHAHNIYVAVMKNRPGGQLGHVILNVDLDGGGIMRSGTHNKGTVSW